MHARRADRVAMRLKATPTHAFTGKNIPWLLANQSELRSSHTFLRFEPFGGNARTWTYREFSEDVARVAAGMAQLGVVAGDRVVIHMGNCPEFLLSWFACAHLGAVAVTTNTRSTPSELSFYLQDSQAVAAITQPALLHGVSEAISHLEAPLRFVIVTATDLGEPPSHAAASENLQFEDLRSHGTVDAHGSDALSYSSVQYTSGTTARPKGVVWTHANALWAGKTGSTVLGLGPDDVTLAFLPLFHTNALSYSMLSTLWSGGTLVVQPRFSASRYWDAVVRNGCTWTSSIPFMLYALLDKPRPGPHRLRFWGLGATDVPLIRREFDIRTTGWFGMTETVTLVLASDLNLPNHPMAMGAPVPGYEVKVVDDDDVPVEFGQSGWLKIRAVPGVSLFAGYLNNVEATEDAFDAEGWFSTGDLVTPFDDGDIRFDGRGKDVLRVGAENVSAPEVERVINAVRGVRECAVVAAPDRMLDEVPVAFVLPTGSSDGLAEAVNEACRNALAPFKVPREVILVAELPRVTLGKIDKKLLRAWLAGPRQGPPPSSEPSNDGRSQ